MVKYDFSGWATKNNLKCTDGRTILRDAFKHNDGQTVPLVWNHQHNDPYNVLGHALLENREQGVYAYCKFNDTEQGRNAKILVEHGDVSALSIYANGLKQQGGNVLHGAIREVSLVLAGANPGAFIDSVISHGDGEDEDAIIYTGEELNLSHADEEKTVKDVFDSMTEEQKTVVYAMIGQALEEAGVNDNDEEDEDDEDIAHADQEKQENKEKVNMPNKEKTVKDVFDEMTEEQKTVVYAMIGQALEEAGLDDEEDGGNNVKHNVFDNDYENENVLSHSAITEIITDAKRVGSMRESVLQHGIELEEVGMLFPNEHPLNNTPEFITYDLGWVQKVMTGVSHTPFSRLKALFADITEEQARARGYIKGKQKKEEVFSMLKRTTSPQTIYKLQKMDRDDIIDITDFDVVAFLKKEMRMKLDEEIARAVLIGDGREEDLEEKIKEEHVRSILNDKDLYSIHSLVNVAADATLAAIAEEFIDQAVRARTEYQGSGSPSAYMAEDLLSACLLLKDKNGRRIYKDVNELATAMMVKEIVTVPVMKGVTRNDDKGNAFNLLGIIVNLTDYKIGADKGGAVNMFDDFDIDFNKYTYLIETRCSGSLMKPKSAIVLETAKTTNTEN